MNTYLASVLTGYIGSKANWFFWFVAAIIAGILVMGVIMYIRNTFGNEVTTAATVAMKRTVSQNNNDYDKGSEPDYLVKFDTEDGAEILLKTGLLEYTYLQEGDFGKLVHKGNILVRFERSSY